MRKEEENFPFKAQQRVKKNFPFDEINHSLNRAQREKLIQL